MNAILVSMRNLFQNLLKKSYLLQLLNGSVYDHFNLI